MIRKRLYLLLFLFSSLLSSKISAQKNITGTWEGYMSGQFIQINVKQKGSEVCGFTYDFVIDNRKSYCRAYFTGRYENNFMMINGVSFISNSDMHYLMTIGMLVKNVGGELQMVGRVSDGVSNVTNSGIETVTLRRVSTIPKSVPGKPGSCFEPIKPPVNSKTPPISQKSVEKHLSAKPAKPLAKPVAPTPIKKPNQTENKKPNVAPNKPLKPLSNPVVKKPVLPSASPKKIETILLPPKLAARKQDEQSRIVVNSKKINLKLYDNGTVDDDTISVYYNGKLIVDKKRLSEKPIEINLELDENISVQNITMYAENLGRIPPNTALIVVTAANKRYELRSSADLSKNAVLAFEYKQE